VLPRNHHDARSMYSQAVIIQLPSHGMAPLLRTAKRSPGAAGQKEAPRGAIQNRLFAEDHLGRPDWTQPLGNQDDPAANSRLWTT